MIGRDTTMRGFISLTQHKIFDAVRIILESIFGFEQMFGKQWKWHGEASMTEQMMFSDIIKRWWTILINSKGGSVH